jgi:methionyl-tRNA formyltransferase
MRVVFFGTPDFAVPTLDALLTHPEISVAAVVTQPDRPRTRSHSTLIPSPVKQRAERDAIPVWQPERPRGDEFVTALRTLDAELGVVVAYGHILRSEVLDTPRRGMINVHASLLPRWRGAAPIHWAVLSGDARTGVTIMQMDPGLDAGPVWHARSTSIEDTDTTGTLFGRLAKLGAEALIEALPMITSGSAPTPQDASQVTLAPKVERAHARIDWTASATHVSCLIRAMDPAPGAWTMFGDEPIKLSRPAAAQAAGSLSTPGTILPRHDDLLVACNDAWLSVSDVQPAGRRRMPAAAWWRGTGAPAGAHFA